MVSQSDLLHKLPPENSLHTLLLHPDKVSGQPHPRPSGQAEATISAEALGAAGIEAADWLLGTLGGPKDTCYIIYTSGSTGKPKGVVVMHQGLTAYTAWFRAHFGITSKCVGHKAVGFDLLTVQTLPARWLLSTAPTCHGTLQSHNMCIAQQQQHWRPSCLSIPLLLLVLLPPVMCSSKRLPPTLTPALTSCGPA